MISRIVFAFAFTAVASPLVTATPSLIAQEDVPDETLLKGGIESGGFGGPVLRFTDIGGQFAVLFGGRGGWIINRTFILGGGGYGLVNDVRIDATLPGRVDFGYGGLELTYVHASNRLYHASITALIGGGTIKQLSASDGVFVFEPYANGWLNVTRYFRISAGLGYRFVSGVDFPGLSNSDFASPIAELGLNFGSF